MPFSQKSYSFSSLTKYIKIKTQERIRLLLLCMNVKIGPSIYGTKYAESVREYGAERDI
jgi:hypothetical protein